MAVSVARTCLGTYMKTFVLAALASLAATAAHADLTFCNDGPTERQVAIAYSDKGVWTSEGWWKIPGTECKVVVAGDLTRQHYYFYAPLNGSFTGEGFKFCTTAEPFTLTGADGDCAAMAADKQDFAHIDTGKTAKDFVFTLAEEVPAEPKPAEEPVAETGTVETPAEAPTESTADASAAVAAFAAGTHGEPFSVNALVQTCTAGDGGDFCFFYAEGARWAVDRTGPSNPAAVQMLADLPVNTPLIITGDMVSFGDITADAVVSMVELGAADEWAQFRDGMQGSWVSTEDAKSVLHIFGSEQISEYDGQIMETSVMTFANACPGGEDIGPVVFTQMMGGDPMDTPCYAILDVTADRMDLSYVGRGNTLSYTRMK